MDSSDPDEGRYFALVEKWNWLRSRKADSDATDKRIADAILRALRVITQKNIAAVNVSEADFYHLVELRNHVRGESFDTKSSNDLFVAALNDILTRVLKAQIADQNDSANGADIDHLVKLKMDAEFEDLGAMSTPFFDQAFEKAFPRAIEIMTKASPIETLLKDIVELRDRAMEMIGFSASKLPKLHLSEGLESQFACAIDTALEADIANIFGDPKDNEDTATASRDDDKKPPANENSQTIQDQAKIAANAEAQAIETPPITHHPGIDVATNDKKVQDEKLQITEGSEVDVTAKAPAPAIETLHTTQDLPADTASTQESQAALNSKAEKQAVKPAVPDAQRKASSSSKKKPANHKFNPWTLEDPYRAPGEPPVKLLTSAAAEQAAFWGSKRDILKTTSTPGQQKYAVIPSIPVPSQHGKQKSPLDPATTASTSKTTQQDWVTTSSVLGSPQPAKQKQEPPGSIIRMHLYLLRGYRRPNIVYTEAKILTKVAAPRRED